MPQVIGTAGERGGGQVRAERGLAGGVPGAAVGGLAEHPAARAAEQPPVAQALVVTPKTAANHIEHIYTKLGISSRAAATLYATQHGLMGAFEPAEP